MRTLWGRELAYNLTGSFHGDDERKEEKKEEEQKAKGLTNNNLVDTLGIEPSTPRKCINAKRM